MEHSIRSIRSLSDLVGSWLGFGARMNNEIIVISNEVQKCQKILSNIRSISERTRVFRSVWNLLDCLGDLIHNNFLQYLVVKKNNLTHHTTINHHQPFFGGCWQVAAVILMATNFFFFLRWKYGSGHLSTAKDDPPRW